MGADPLEAQLFTRCPQLFIERLSAHWPANHSTRDDEIRGSWVGLSLPPFEYIKQLRGQGHLPRCFRFGGGCSEEDVCIRNCCPREQPSLADPRGCVAEDCGEDSMRPSRQRIDQVVQVLRTQDRRLAEAVLLH